MIDLVILTAIVVFIVDLSGFISNIKRWVSKWIGVEVKSLKPIDCSLCMTWWIGLLWIACAGCFDLWHILAVAMCAYMSDVVRGILQVTHEGAVWLIIKIQDKI